MLFYDIFFVDVSKAIEVDKVCSKNFLLKENGHHCSRRTRMLGFEVDLFGLWETDWTPYFSSSKNTQYNKCYHQ